MGFVFLLERTQGFEVNNHQQGKVTDITAKGVQGEIDHRKWHIADPSLI